MTREITEWNDNGRCLVSNTTNTFVNVETGEAIEMQMVEKRYFGQKQFWKLYLTDFLAILGIMDSKKLDVISYIMDHISPSTNEFRGTYRKIANGCGVSVGTVGETMRRLMDCNFLCRTEIECVYMLNPEVLMQGSESKRRSLVISYREENPEPIDLGDADVCEEGVLSSGTGQDSHPMLGAPSPADTPDGDTPVRKVPPA